MRTIQQALVIGGHGGIGVAIVRTLKKACYAVTAPSHSKLDVTDPSAISNFFADDKKGFDCLVFAAGINTPKPLSDCTADDLHRTIETNTLGFVSAVQACIPHMRKRHFGRIVVISSLYGLISRVGRLPYALSKHALTGAVQTMALELAADGILVNAVSPGFVMTQMTAKNNSPKRIRELEASIPLQRMATGDEIAYAVNFLCSPQNTYITGQNLVVDGGYMSGGWQK